MAQLITEDDKIKSQQAVYENIRSLLEEVARNGAYVPDNGVVYHETPKNKVSLPVNMRKADAAKMLAEMAAAEAEIKPFVHQFNYRPMDGANALRQVLLETFGSVGRGIVGQNLDQTINTDWKTKIKVPWGRISFAPINATLNLTVWESNEFGSCFQLVVEAPGEMESAADGLAYLIEKYLQQHSIYKGKAFTVTKNRNNNFEDVKFLRLVEDPTVTYNKDVEIQLQDTVWGTCEFPELAKDVLGVKTNLKTLLHGPYGTGKSECLRRTAQIATTYGRTYIQFPTKGTLEDLVRTIAVAKQHEPSIIGIEDVDALFENTDPTFSTVLTNLVDGVETKDNEVMLMMTTNFPEKLPKNMLRRGRTDSLVFVGPLERDALETMVKGVIGEENLADNVDFDAIFDKMHGWTPSFIRSTFEDAKRSAGFRMAREDKAAGKDPLTTNRTMVLTTQDFLRAAVAATDQFDRHDSMAEIAPKPTLEAVFKELVQNAITSGSIVGRQSEGEWDISFEDVSV